MRAYIASGWFTEDQEVARQEILEAVQLSDIDYYSPKDDMLYDPKVNTTLEVFNENLAEIRKSDVLIASTVGKDMGVLFECGYAYAINKGIVYYFKHDGKFNIMLAESGIKVVSTKQELVEYLNAIKRLVHVEKTMYKGEVE